ncbi:MAG: alpha/beta hydrolase [Erythrobacter sp.]
MHTSIADWRSGAKYFEFEGNKIAYWRAGTGKPLLLVHGFPTCSWDWAGVWEALSAGHSLIACDMIGFGLSDKPSGGYSIHRQTDVHEALLAHLDISEWDVLVHDYGVSVGQELLARQADQTGAAGLGQMVFLNGGIFPDQHRALPIQKLGTSPLGFLVSAMMSRKRFGTSFPAVFGPHTKPSEQELDEFWEFIAEKRGHRIFHKLLHYIADRRTHKDRWEAALVASQARIGLINGALDPVSGKHAYDRWRQVVPQAKHHLLDAVGHYPQVEAPTEVTAKVLEWLG